jgi:hypothetical protein
MPSSQYLGVSRDKATAKWGVRIRAFGRVVWLGRHATELEAAYAREDYIRAHPELHARSNFHKEEQ